MIKMKDLIRENPIIAIMRNVPIEITVDYINSIAKGGIRCFEIATNSKDAFDQIRLAKKSCGKEVILGAGTVLTVEAVKRARDAGAEFLLSPSTNEAVLDYCAKNNIKLLPGVMTPTDVSISTFYGFKTMKLFPASDLPMSYIKSLKGPFDETDYVAVGGVNTENINTFFEHGFIGVGIGSNLVSKDKLRNSKWEQITDDIKTLVTSVGGMIL